MIQNKHQYKVTHSKLKGLEQSLADLASNPQGLSEGLLQAQKAGVQVWIDRLNVEIAEYDRLQQGESVFKISSLTELPIALIQARIASGMTQKELAEKIGVKEQQIQRYEANHYDSASFDRLNEVYTALGISFKEAEVVMQIAAPATDAQPPIHSVTRSRDSEYLGISPEILRKAVFDVSNFRLNSDRLTHSKSEHQCALAMTNYQFDRSMSAQLFS